MLNSLGRSLIAVGVILSGTLWVDSARAEPIASASVIASNTSFGGFQSVLEKQQSDDLAQAFLSIEGGFGRSSADLSGTLTGLAVAAEATITAIAVIRDTITLTDPTPGDNDSGARLIVVTIGTLEGAGRHVTTTAQKLGVGPGLIQESQTGFFSPPNANHTGVWVLPGGTYDLSIGFVINVHGTGVANFESSVTASIDVPPGVTFTSASGIFLTQQEEPPTPSLPEPATLFLTAVGLAGIWVIRKRSRTA